MREQSAPRVTVIMSVYNGEKYLSKAIASILNQTFGDFEFVIINDGSRDGSARILEEFASQDLRLRIYHQENSGLATALNRAASVAKGEYLARMDADDIAFPTRLEKQVSFLNDNPEVGVVGTAFYKMDESGRIMEMWIMPTEDQAIRNVMMQHNPFAHPSVVMRKDVFSIVGGYNMKYRVGQDYELWFRMVPYCKFANLDEPLMLWRFYNRNTTFSKQRVVLQNSLKTRLRAIKTGNYPVISIVYLLQSIVMMLLPSTIREAVRRWYKRSHISVKHLSENEIKRLVPPPVLNLLKNPY